MIAGRDIIETRSPEDTGELGRRLAHRLRGGDLVLLIGSLGAGKSVFARGIALALGVLHWRGSPTFNLIHEYDTSPPMFHADLYRLGAGDVDDLGLEEYARMDSILVVEWADRAPGQLRQLASKRVIQVDIAYAGGDRRLISTCSTDVAEPSPS